MKRLRHEIAVAAPVRQIWAVVHQEIGDLPHTRGKMTSVVYETSMQLRGALRFAGRLVESQVDNDARRNLEALKHYVETGKRSP